MTLLRGRKTPREGAGQLPALLLEKRASYPTNYLLLGRNSSPVLRRGRKGFRPCPRISPLLPVQQRPH